MALIWVEQADRKQMTWIPIMIIISIIIIILNIIIIIIQLEQASFQVTQSPLRHKIALLLEDDQIGRITKKMYKNFILPCDKRVVEM